MRRIIKFSVLVMMIGMFVGEGFAENEIVLSNGEWPPYTSETLENYGIFSQIVTEAFAIKGITVKYKFYPWTRALYSAKDGKTDGVVTFFRTPEREKDFHFSLPIIESQFVFFHLKSFNFEWDSLEDLQNIKIGGNLAANYGEAFQAAEKEGRISIERIANDELNFKKLLGGRFNVLLQDKIVGYSMLKKIFKSDIADKFIHHSKPVRTDPMYLLLSRKNAVNEQRINIFNDGLRQLQKSNKFSRYLFNTEQMK